MCKPVIFKTDYSTHKKEEFSKEIRSIPCPKLSLMGGEKVKSVQEAKLLQCACPEYYAYISVWKKKVLLSWFAAAWLLRKAKRKTGGWFTPVIGVLTICGCVSMTRCRWCRIWVWAGQRSRLGLLSEQQHTSATGGTADFALQPNTVQVVIGITPATFKETKTSGSGLCCFCVVVLKFCKW